MIARSLACWLRCQCRGLASDQRGISAMEFALLAPLMLTMYFGSIEVTDAISADRQITLVASTVADIASESSTLASSDISGIWLAAEAVLSPFPTANAKVVLSSVVIDANGTAYVDWSATLNGTALTAGTNVTSQIPTALLANGPSSVLWGQTSYAYKPVIGYVVTGTLNMSSQIFMRPRLSSCVQYTGSYCVGGAVNAP